MSWNDIASGRFHSAKQDGQRRKATKNVIFGMRRMVLKGSLLFTTPKLFVYQFLTLPQHDPCNYHMRRKVEVIYY